MMRLAIYDRIMPNTEPKYSSYANTIAKRFEDNPEMKVIGVFELSRLIADTMHERRSGNIINIP